MRSLVIFILNNKVLSIESGIIYDTTIANIKKKLAKEHCTSIDKIEYSVMGGKIHNYSSMWDGSGYDISKDGLHLSDSIYDIIYGIRFIGNVNDFIDNIKNDNEFIKYLEFM